MRKLTDLEATALDVMNREGSVLLNDDELQPISRKLLRDTFDALVKKKRAQVEVTDGGFRYWPLTRA